MHSPGFCSSQNFSIPRHSRSRPHTFSMFLIFLKTRSTIPTTQKERCLPDASRTRECKRLSTYTHLGSASFPTKPAKIHSPSRCPKYINPPSLTSVVHRPACSPQQVRRLNDAVAFSPPTKRSRHLDRSRSQAMDLTRKRLKRGKSPRPTNPQPRRREKFKLPITKATLRRIRIASSVPSQSCPVNEVNSRLNLTKVRSHLKNSEPVNGLRRPWSPSPPSVLF